MTDGTTGSQKPYIGRFAPSPSGPLHFGSLVCALASYLDAKSRRGQWLLRIEDIDPPREQAGAKDAIKRSLEAHGLLWDGEIRYQSTRSDAYHGVLEQLKDKQLIYPCSCTRKRLTQLQGRYDGYCRIHPPPPDAPAAWRVKVSGLPQTLSHIHSRISFVDRVYGAQQEDLAQSSGDFVIHRKDGLFAYQLAVVIDDIDQGITDVLRGDDLLDTTAKQIYLYRLLNAAPPTFTHIPVIRNAKGDKLSKQTHAPAIEDSQANSNIQKALQALGLAVSQDCSLEDAIAWGEEHFTVNNLRPNA